MNQKIIICVLILVIILSVVTIFISFNSSSDNLNSSDYSIKDDSNSGTVNLIVEGNSENSDETN